MSVVLYLRVCVLIRVCVCVCDFSLCQEDMGLERLICV